MGIVREVQKGDLEALSKLFDGDSTSKWSEEQRIKNFEQIQNDHSYRVLVAEEKGEIIGTLMGIICYDFGTNHPPFLIIKNLLVKEAYRGKEIERALLEEIEKRAKQEKAIYSILLSDTQADKTDAFYQEKGYQTKEIRAFKKEF